MLTYGRHVDHINRNFSDNRVSNYRSVTARFNLTNVSTKTDNIYSSKNGKRFKCHMNIDNQIYFKWFSSFEEAKKYRDDYLIPLKEKSKRNVKERKRY